MPDLLSPLLAALSLLLAGWLLRSQRRPAAGPGGSCRRYSAPGRCFPLKKWAMWGLLCLAFRQRRRASGAARRAQTEAGAPGGQPGRGAEERERLQGLVCDAHALDSVYFTGFTETNKTFVITRLGRRPNGLCEMWLFLRVDGIGEFEHPVHPDMMVSDESEKCWRGGGLMIECLQPHRCWKIKFNGRLRKGPYRHQWNEEEGELVHVKFSFHWTSFSDIFDFNLESHPKVFAHAIALEKWSVEFFRRVKEDGEQHSRYEQWGQSIGDIEIEGHGKKEVSLRGVRSHSYGIRNWAEIYRYVMILMHCEDGTSAHLTIICIPATTTHLAVGYVLFPDGKKAGIDWSSASLAEMADDGFIRDLYQVSFTAGGQFFEVCAMLDKQARPVVYNGLTGTGVFHECIADFQLNRTVPGWGLVEFYYSRIPPGISYVTKQLNLAWAGTLEPWFLFKALSLALDWTPEAMAVIAVLSNTCPDVLSVELPRSVEGFLPDEDLFFLTLSEIGEVLRHRLADIIFRARRRRRILDRQMALQFPEVNVGRLYNLMRVKHQQLGPCSVGLTSLANVHGRGALLAHGGIYHIDRCAGIIISHGVAKGTACVLKIIQEASSIKQEDIIIVATIDGGWTSCFPFLGG